MLSLNNLSWTAPAYLSFITLRILRVLCGIKACCSHLFPGITLITSFLQFSAHCQPVSQPLSLSGRAISWVSPALSFSAGLQKTPCVLGRSETWMVPWAPFCLVPFSCFIQKLRRLESSAHRWWSNARLVASQVAKWTRVLLSWPNHLAVIYPSSILQYWTPAPHPSPADSALGLAVYTYLLLMPLISWSVAWLTRAPITKPWALSLCPMHL